MDHVPTFEQFLNEGFVKAYGDKIKAEDFEKIPVGSEVLYAGATYEVIKNDKVTLQLKPTKGIGRPTKVNLSMFNQAGAIRESINESLDLDGLQKKYPNAKITLTPNERFKDAFNARVDIVTQGGKTEYLGALKGPASKEDALEFFNNILSREYDKFY